MSCHRMTSHCHEGSHEVVEENFAPEVIDDKGVETELDDGVGNFKLLRCFRVDHQRTKRIKEGLKHNLKSVSN